MKKIERIDRKRLQCAESEGNYRRLLQLAQQQVIPALYHYRRLQSGLYFCLYYRRALCPDKKPWCGNPTFWLLPGSARPCLCHRQPAGDPDGQDAQHQGDITHGCLRCGIRRPVVAGYYFYGNRDTCNPDSRDSSYRICRWAHICRDTHFGHEFNRQKNRGCGGHARLCGNGHRITGSVGCQLGSRRHSITDDDIHAGTCRDYRPGLHEQPKIIVVGILCSLLLFSRYPKSPNAYCFHGMRVFFRTPLLIFFVTGYCQV